MIKFTKEQGEVLGKFNKFSSISAKSCIIELLFEDSGMLSETFNTDELKLKAIQAILDGEWEVEEPLYYVHLVSGEVGYLNIGKNTGIKWLSTKYESETHKTKFTRAEVKAIDPRYLDFLEEVE